MTIRGGTVVTHRRRAARRRLTSTDERIEAVGAELAGAASEIDARGLTVLPAAHRRSSALQRAGPHGVGRRGHREPGAGGGRGRAVLRHAAEFDSLHGECARVRAQAGGARSRVHHRLRAVGRSDPGQRWRAGRNWRNAAWSDSRRSSAIRACRSFRAPTISRYSKECGRRRGWACRSRSMPKARRSRRRWRGVAWTQGAPAFAIFWPRGRWWRSWRRSSAPRCWPARRGAKLHIVHVSSGRGAVLAAEARARGVDVSIETCPHYLCFTEEDVERLGAIAKCAPPLAGAGEQDALWDAVLDGTVDIVASDHSPAPPEMKTGDFWRAWGGIAGVQSTLAALLDQGHHERALPLERIASLDRRGARPPVPHRRQGRHRARARRRSGARGSRTNRCTLARTTCCNGIAISPYVGRSFRGVVRRTHPPRARPSCGRPHHCANARPVRPAGTELTCMHLGHTRSAQSRRPSLADAGHVRARVRCRGS